MANVRIFNYGNGKSKQWNSTAVAVGDLTLFFSYRTIVAFQVGYNLVISENVWSTTTGKHLNWVNDDKSLRISNSEFNRKLEELLTKINVNL